MAENSPNTFYQTVNFHFSVEFSTIPGESIDVRFQSVTGLDSTMDTESIKEGGENRFEHVMPTRRKYGPLTLKRGLLKPSDSKLTAWLKKAFDEEQIEVIPTVNIMLLGEDHKPMLKWTINNVWPRSWKIGELNAERGEVLIETLELNYNRLLFQNP
ncbi:phage tail protein [Pseudoflavitalea sp. G-6-1-2]|uniref:phage tail protein n=1 Tax=Pseudoflavitalea sp. G-6-1-2 TaxID=2728841 RepID=UPI00146D8DAF|nr:phage tail protein [Pseudoflavitalea sp. G-6-1-2]NML21655.1 phage tail protein [Pseudoflavitalea sp. G-6-1-2]